MPNVTVIPFDDVTTVTAAGFTVVAGTFEINTTVRAALDPGSPSVNGGTNNVIRQTDSSGTTTRRSARLTNTPDIFNFEMSLEMSIATGGTTRAGGVIFRGALGSGYALELDAVNNRITLWDTAGSWTRLHQVTTASTDTHYITTDTVIRIKIKVQGAVISWYINNVLIARVSNSTHSGIYFGVLATSSVVWWDNISIISLDTTRTVRTTDWIKGAVLVEIPDTGDRTVRFAYDTANMSSSLSNLITTNVNAITVIVPSHMHTVTSNDIWWDDDDNNHYNATNNPTANNNKLRTILSSIRGHTYVDIDGQTRNVRACLNPCRFRLTQDGGWRGDINPASRSQWWTNYKAYIVNYAALAELYDTEYFVIGSQLRNMEGGINSADVTDWNDLITQVRAVYSGQIVYAINWSRNSVDLTTVTTRATWLNNVDIIGIDAYFELTGSYTMLNANVAAAASTITLPNATETAKYILNAGIILQDDINAEFNYITNITGNVITLLEATDNAYTTAQNARIVEASGLTPSISDIIRGWDNGRTGDNPFTFVQTIATTYGKPIIFNEIGYRSIVGAVVFPWEDADPPAVKDSVIVTYQNDTNNNWGWGTNNILREDTEVQEKAYTAALARWWDVSWFYGMFFSSWTGNPSEGRSPATGQYATLGGMWDADYSPQNKAAQNIMTNFFAAANARDTALDATTYTTPEQVARQLQVPNFSSTTTPTRYEVIRWILQAEDWLDVIMKTSWKSRAVTEIYEFVDRGVKLNNDPIRSVTRVRLWNGSTFDTLTEGRTADYHVDLQNGSIYFTNDPFIRFIRPLQLAAWNSWGSYKKPVEVTYTYGKYFQQSGANLRDRYARAIEYAATIWACIQIVNSNDYSVLVPSGTDKVNLENKVKFWQTELEKIELEQERLFVI